MATHASPLSFLSASLLFFLLLCPFNTKAYAFQGRVPTDKHQLQPTHYTVQLSSLLPSSVCSPSSKGRNEGSLEVVHRHGPCSPLTEDRANAPTLTQILSQDQSRVNSIQSRFAINSGRNGLLDSQTSLPAKSGNSLGTGNYIVTVGLGTPKSDLSLVFDTGSDLTWTQCRPCARYCYKQQQPTFDPSKSATYSNITCKSPLCSQLSSATGMNPGCSATTCLYGVQYGDSSYSVGYFGKDKLTITATDSFDDYLFGCGQNNRGLFGSTAGLLGLGQDKLSFVSQTAQKYGKYFSYCLPSSSSSTGHLTFGGKGASSTALKFTPLVTNPQNPSFYFVDITAISVGGTVLSIDKSVFSNAGTIIDSGTIITRLPPAAYAAVRTAFRQLMKKYPTSPAFSILDTCYDLRSYSSVSVPKISFYFSGNVAVDLALTGILIRASASQLCLAFAGNSDASDVAIFGNVQQQTLEVAYDVAGGKIGFGAGGCS